MSQDNKPREFWIDSTDDAGEEDLFFGDALKEHPKQGPIDWQNKLLHVIEYSAYESAQKENAKLKEQVKVLKEALACFKGWGVAEKALEKVGK